MRSEWRQWSDQYRQPIPIADGQAVVVYPRIGGRVVEHEDGSWSPGQFTYVEAPADPALPYYVVECEQSGPDLLPRITAVHVLQRPGGREVRSQDLRHLKLEYVIEDAWQHATRQPAKVRATAATPADLLQQRDDPGLKKQTIRGLRKRARRRITTEVLEEVAQVYRDGRASGAPVQAVAEHFGKASSTAFLYVKQAREAGMDMGDDGQGS